MQMNATQIGPVPASVLSRMKGPGDYRSGIWRGRVLQIKVTNSCDLDCKNCSVAVGIAKKLHRKFFMSPDQFRVACRSLVGFPGVVGMFGGNPCIHPQFDELCAIMRDEIPDMDQRGLWSNRLFGHGAVCRQTFSPDHSNLNVHESQFAWDEMRRDWPESKPLSGGLTTESRHGPIFGSMMDIGVSETDMWDRIGSCYVNQKWSAEITVVGGALVGYFCEIAATMAELENDATTGAAIGPYWWTRPMHTFQQQVGKYCTRCLIPMNGKKVNAADETAAEQYTAAWAPLMLTIRGRVMEHIATAADIAGGEPATKYLSRGVMPAAD